MAVRRGGKFEEVASGGVTDPKAKVRVEWTFVVRGATEHDGSIKLLLLISKNGSSISSFSLDIMARSG